MIQNGASGLVYVGPIVFLFLTSGFVDCGGFVVRIWGINTCVIICCISKLRKSFI